MLPKGLLKEYSHSLSMLLRFMDVGMVFIAGFTAYASKFGSFQISHSYGIAILISAMVMTVTFSFLNIYSSMRSKSFISYCLELLQAMVMTAVFLAGLAFLTKSGEFYSRVWFGLFMVITFLLIVFLRSCLLLFLRFMRAKGLNEKRVVIFGAGEIGSKFAQTVQEALWTGFRIVTFIDDYAQEKPATVNGVEVLQTPQKLCDFLREHAVDEVWIALPLRAELRVKQILYDLRHLPITTRFVLDIFGLDLLNHSIDTVAGFPVLNICSTPMVGFNRLLKALEDRLLALLILSMISPLLLLIAIGVKYSSKGPIFFKQKRLGWDGRVINVYKFRSMVEHQEENGQITQAKLDDQRVTPLGKFLRRTSLDELPQFINVLQGRMSIVGPRPHALQHNDFYKHSIHTYMHRHKVKPGITGWAQVNGWRGETDTLKKMQKRVEYDLYYINNWSLGFDLKIILLTILRGFSSRNAY